MEFHFYLYMGVVVVAAVACVLFWRVCCFATLVVATATATKEKQGNKM